MRMKAVCFSSMLASTYEPTQRQIPKHHYHYHTHRCENLKDLMEADYRDGRWVELTRDRVHWLAVVLAVLNLRVLSPDSWFSYKPYLDIQRQ
jgi:hypothetical protein